MHHTEQLGFEVESSQPQFDGKGKMIDYVNAPPHYTRLKPEPIEVVEAWELGFFEGCALEYLARARFKGDEVTDLRKAVAMLTRRIKQLGQSDAQVQSNFNPGIVVSQPVPAQGKVS